MDEFRAMYIFVANEGYTGDLSSSRDAMAQDGHPGGLSRRMS
jgi:hypothetical protein